MFSGQVGELDVWLGPAAEPVERALEGNREAAAERAASAPMPQPPEEPGTASARSAPSLSEITASLESLDTDLLRMASALEQSEDTFARVVSRWTPIAS